MMTFYLFFCLYEILSWKNEIMNIMKKQKTKILLKDPFILLRGLVEKSTKTVQEKNLTKM